ncbi:MAG: DUF411 domain-containing protein [Thiothrix sp.]|nr:DUF411 domain-containing protein [Thiothrix sp.]HPQ96928.1 DUF411 domain-containing protein [Thiolinea sp.]
MTRTQNILLALLGGAGALGLAGVLFAVSLPADTAAAKPDPDLPLVTVYKNATCGCCKDWIKHMQDNGFRVEAHDVGNLLPYKEQARLGAGMGSCHTAFVDGYALEGHVPAQDVKRLLTEKPAISGLAVPRMPIGSPGMEVPGQAADAYQVISYKDGRETGVFSDYPAGQ